jgi:hypothetical protein
MTQPLQRLRRSATALRQASALTITLLVAGFYLAFTVAALSLHQGDPLWFVWIGERYADLDPDGRTGYDGQFIYYLARDGQDAIPHLDNPAYRLQRILLPVVVRLLSMGSPALIPWVLIAVNLTAIVVTTYSLARWLEDREIAPGYAVGYALYVGTFLAYSRGLTEPLAFCLVTWGAVLWFRDKPAWAIVPLALATLTKEITLLFVIGLFLSSLAERNLRSAFWAAAAFVPLLIWELVLFVTMDTMPLISGPSLERVPLIGILPHLTLEPGRLSGLLFAGLPALALLIASLFFLWQTKGRSAVVWWLLLNGLFVVLMPIRVYDHVMHAGRNACGLALAVALMLPSLDKRLRLPVLVYLTLPTLMWLVPVLRWSPWASQI